MVEKSVREDKFGAIHMQDVNLNVLKVECFEV